MDVAGNRSNWRRTQVVRERSAKPSFAGSNPAGAFSYEVEKMRVGKEEVLRIAALAHIKIEPGEIDHYTKNFNEILDFIAQMNEVDTKQVSSAFHPASEPSTPMRADTPQPSLTTEEVLRNAPERFADYFLVPKVVE